MVCLGFEPGATDVPRRNHGAMAAAPTIKSWFNTGRIYFKFVSQHSLWMTLERCFFAIFALKFGDLLFTSQPDKLKVEPVEGHRVDDVGVAFDVVDSLGPGHVPNDDPVIVAAAQQNVFGRRMPLDNRHTPPIYQNFTLFLHRRFITATLYWNYYLYWMITNVALIAVKGVFI